jgi:hypothetical protein
LQLFWVLPSCLASSLSLLELLPFCWICPSFPFLPASLPAPFVFLLASLPVPLLSWLLLFASWQAFLPSSYPFQLASLPI